MGRIIYIRDKHEIMDIYIIKKLPYVEGFVMTYNYKTATKKQLPKLLKDGWEIVKKENFILFHVKTILNKLSYGEKFQALIAIIIFILGLLISVVV